MHLILNRWGGVKCPWRKRKMKTCRKCGHEIQDDFNVCPYCGSRQDNKITCQNCGAIVEDDVAFCPRCGKDPRVKQASTTVHYSTRPSYSYDDKPIKGKALGVLIVFLLSIIGFILVYVIGDEEAKQGAKIMLIVEICLGVFLGILMGIVMCAGMSAAGY